MTMVRESSWRAYVDADSTILSIEHVDRCSGSIHVFDIGNEVDFPMLA